jgi:membrane-associated phospholipid phosphatase
MIPKSAKLIAALGILWLSFTISLPLRAQDAPALDSASAPANGAAAAQPAQTLQPAPAAPQSPAPASPDRPVSWVGLVPNLLHDQKDIWLFPFSVARGHHWKPVLVFTLVTATLVATTDNPSGRYFQRTQSFNEFNSIFRDSHTASAMFAFPVAFYGIGLIRRDSYAQHTFLLAGEAAIDSTLLTTVMKDISRRVQPDNVPVGGSFADPWFQEHGSVLGGIGSFPCGHCIDAFSVATVFADRYPKYKWVAFGLAGLVSFTRITLQAHNPSDAFAGAFLGFTISHYTVQQF